jgi:predicted pyridoxine 5'-phosphate oxidase superfamily flavin-nucleotide-binding protein
MAEPYGPEQRDLQDHFDTRRMADRLTVMTTDTIGDAHRDFIEAREAFFLSTVDDDGWPQCSWKGGAPGFVRVLDERTLAFPLYDGNGMFLSAGNIVATGKVGMLFVDLQGGTRLRLNGEATLDPADPLLDAFPGAKLVVRVQVRHVFPNCRRYVHRYELVEPLPFVPAASGDAPVPDWKRHPWFDGALPEGDPALDPDRPDAPSLPEL